MANDTETLPKRSYLKSWKFILVIALIIAYLAAGTYGVMSDNSVRGLTVKMFYVSRYCTTDQSTSLKTLNYNVQGSIWSSSSIQTSLSHLSFTLSVDGSTIGTNSQGDSSFGPGQGVSFTVTFTHPTLNPTILPLSSTLVLSLTGTVAAGLYSATEAASDRIVQTFSSSGC
jgi:hypothetical protein